MISKDPTIPRLKKNGVRRELWPVCPNGSQYLRLRNRHCGQTMLKTRWIKHQKPLRMCGERAETVQHIVCECSSLNVSTRGGMHAKHIHWMTCEKYVLSGINIVRKVLVRMKMQSRFENINTVDSLYLHFERDRNIFSR